MLNGKELLDNNTHIIYEKITTDELPLKVIEVTLAKDDPNLIPHQLNFGVMGKLIQLLVMV